MQERIGSPVSRELGRPLGARKEKIERSREMGGAEGCLAVSFEDEDGRRKREEETQRMRQRVRVSCGCVRGPTRRGLSM